MQLLKFVRVIICASIVLPIAIGQDIQPQTVDLGAEICNIVTQSPMFDPDMVFGTPWRIYYAWNMKLDNKCLDMTFKNVTPKVINRIWNDMFEYVETQPKWDDAIFLVWMGRTIHEMLMFGDKGPAGSVIGVPNIVRDRNITPPLKSVPLLKFHMKIIHHGKYLLMSDCQIGVTTMSARKNDPPYRAEVAGVASKFDFGNGFHACISDNRLGETIVNPE